MFASFARAEMSYLVQRKMRGFYSRFLWVIFWLIFLSVLMSCLFFAIVLLLMGFVLFLSAGSMKTLASRQSNILHYFY